ncbi:hypothetical protein AAG928_004205 [Enterobacter hormaechei]
MTTQLLDGPGRTLECIHPKFMVDLVQGRMLHVTPSWGHSNYNFVSV